MVENVHEGSREKQRQRGEKYAEIVSFRCRALTRPMPETAPVLALRAKKIPTDKGWDSLYWWRRGESNPRPQALRLVLYMLSRIFVLVAPRSNRRESCATSLVVLVARVRPARLTIS